MSMVLRIDAERDAEALGETSDRSGSDASGSEEATQSGGAPRGGLEPEPALEWSFNPWSERPARSILAALVTLAGGLLLLSLGVAPLAAVALSAALAGSLAPLLLPSRCRVDREGVAERRLLGWERRKWDDIGRAQWVGGGLLISPFAEPRRLDAFRALLLPMPKRERSTLTVEILRRLARHGL